MYLFYCRYFQWVRQVQRIMQTWQKHFIEKELNFEDIMLYANYQSGLEGLGHALCATSTVIDPHSIQEYKTSFLQNFEMLNVLLLKYIPDKPEAKWCSLPSLLAQYGVAFPSHLQDPLTKYVRFPDETKTLGGGTLNIPNTTGQFNPGHEISLQVSRDLSLKAICKLVQDLKSFLHNILDHIDMLVFFRLHQSKMFDKYLRLFLKKEAEQSKRMNPAAIMSTFHLPIHMVAESEPEEGLPLSVLQRSLENTKQLLVKLVEGKATYKEIRAEGNLDLLSLDIEREFITLDDFTVHFKQTLRSGNCLTGVQSMLELFQYKEFIPTIHGVCEQYNLQGCLEDCVLKELVTLAEELQPVEHQNELTLIKASEMMKRVKACLFGDQQPNSQCLELFKDVSDSAAFYQFIKDNGFVGKRGKALFSQQYQLITAQLQHEEYDETVLNHLFAAFKFMSPFMDTHQNFRSLMKQVLNLDTSNGLKQLETVNTNITLIQLWFSRAEVREV